MHFKQFHFFKRDLQKGPKCYEKMHGLGIIQKVQQYLKLVCIFWRNCLEFFPFQMNGVYFWLEVRAHTSHVLGQGFLLMYLDTLLKFEISKFYTI